MTELLRLYVDIAFLRRGPEDIPRASVVLLLTALGYFVVNAAVSVALPPLADRWPVRLTIDVVFILLWYWLLLRVTRKPERFLQTTSAVFGYQAIVAPLWIASGWLAGHFRNNTSLVVPVTLLLLAVFVWTLTVNVRILRSALGWPVGACIGLVCLQMVAEYLLNVGILPAPAPAASTTT